MLKQTGDGPVIVHAGCAVTFTTLLHVLEQLETVVVKLIVYEPDVPAFTVIDDPVEDPPIVPLPPTCQA